MPPQRKKPGPRSKPSDAVYVWVKPYACEDCRFYEGGSGLPTSNGTCRKKPPRVVYEDGPAAVTRWPTVRARDWCGEFRR
jgi:hypothetical protein